MEISNETKLPATVIPQTIAHHETITLFDGSAADIRPICPADEQMMVAFHQSLSDQTVERRYFGHLKLAARIASEHLKVSCLCTAQNIALVVDRQNPITRHHEILGVGRLVVVPATENAELAFVVADQRQHRHLGAALLRGLLSIAQQNNLVRVYMMILPENLDMLRLCDQFGFTSHGLTGQPIKASKEIFFSGD